jgi:hypothetical protein
MAYRFYAMDFAFYNSMGIYSLLGQLKKIGYNGMIGYQGWSEGGDAYSKLSRSLKAFRDMERRLEAHPHWADLK